jgi:hypothetical protein
VVGDLRFSLRFSHTLFSLLGLLLLRIAEQWFGKSNGGPGGRVFDVYGNGATLLKDFDILKQPGDGTMVVTFDHVKPTAHDMLALIPSAHLPWNTTGIALSMIRISRQWVI